MSAICAIIVYLLNADMPDLRLVWASAPGASFAFDDDVGSIGLRFKRICVTRMMPVMVLDELVRRLG